MPCNRFILVLALFLVFAFELRGGQTGVTAPAADRFLGFMDRLPELIDNRLPFFAPRGAYWFYLRPSLGSPFQGKYFRLDGGAWIKLVKSLDFNIGAQSYLWRDSNDHDATRYGFYGANTGLKYDLKISGPPGTAMSFGIKYLTPVSRPPISLTDGYRHTLPFLTYTLPLSQRLRLAGFVTLGANFIARDEALPGNFGRNTLHSNSLSLSPGLTREFKYFTVSTTLNCATSALVSKHNLQVFSLNPEIILPAENILHVLHRKLPHWHFYVSFSAHATTGPDGRQFGGGTSLRVHFDSRKPR